MTVSIHFEGEVGVVRAEMIALLNEPKAAKGGKVKAEPEVPAVTDAPQAQPVPAPVVLVSTPAGLVNASTVTKDEIRESLKALTVARGEDTGFALLKKYGAKNVTGVFDTGKGTEFVDEAKTLASAPTAKAA